MHGQGFALAALKKKSDGNVRVEIHSAAAVDGDDAVVLPQAAAPQGAGGDDAVNSHTKVGRHVGDSEADVGAQLERAEVNRAQQEQRDAGDHRGGHGSGVAGQRRERALE